MSWEWAAVVSAVSFVFGKKYGTKSAAQHYGRFCDLLISLVRDSRRVRRALRRR